MFQQLIADERGATAIEYGIMAAMIAVVLIGSLLLITPLIADGYAGVADLFPDIP